MSSSFTKLFSSITESTVWAESHSTRIVWVTMLAMADRKGRVWASVTGLANRARVTREECENALVRFLSPDADSRTKDHDGRRIETIDGGWRLLNYVKYREKRDHESRLEYQRWWDRANRAKTEQPILPTDPTHPTTDPTDTTTIRPQPTKAEAEAEAEVINTKKKQPAATTVPVGLPDWVPEDLWLAWMEVRRKLRVPDTHRARVLALRTLERLKEAGHDPATVLEQSIMRGWRGLFEVKASASAPNYDRIMASIKE